MKIAAYSVVLFAIGLFAVGCSTTFTRGIQLTPEGAKIKLASAEEVKGYKYLGMVSASSLRAGRAGGGNQYAMIALKNEAAVLGATHLVLDAADSGAAELVIDERYSPQMTAHSSSSSSPPSPSYWRTKVIIRGAAYRSEQAK